MFHIVTIVMGFETTWSDLCKVQDKKQRLLKAKIAVALQDEFSRVPAEEEIDHVFHLTRAMWKAVSGLHYKRKEQRNAGSSRSSSYDLWSLATPAFQQLIRHS
jgi:hypothetical protein